MTNRRPEVIAESREKALTIIKEHGLEEKDVDITIIQPKLCTSLPERENVRMDQSTVRRTFAGNFSVPSIPFSDL